MLWHFDTLKMVPKCTLFMGVKEEFLPFSDLLPTLSDDGPEGLCSKDRQLLDYFVWFGPLVLNLLWTNSDILHFQ